VNLNHSLLALRKELAEFAGIEESQISNETLLLDLGVDSLAAIESVEELET
jgi:acyl carrier protein